MAKYRIKGPDGETYEVTAPEGATEQDVLSYVRQNAQPVMEGPKKTAELSQYLSEVEAQQNQPAPLNPAEGALRGAFQGATFGFGDEAVAGLTAPIAAGLTDMDLGEAYNRALENERAKIAQFRQESPVAAIGSEVAGAVPTALAAPFGALARGGGLAARMGAGAVEGAIGGGLYGFGAGQDGLGERTQNAAKGAAVGGLVGGAAPAIAQGAKNVYQNTIAPRLAARQARMDPATYGTVTRAMAADDAFTGAGADRIQASGPNAMLADAGPNTAALLDAAVQKSGPAATTARRAIDQRVSGATQTVSRSLDDVLGPPAGLRETARGFSEATRGARQTAYDAAFSSPINYASRQGRNIEGVVSRIPPRVLSKAINEANDELVSLGQRNQQILASISDDGGISFREMPNVMQLDQIKRALQKIGYENVDQFGRPTSEAVRARRLAGELRDALGEAVPAYNEATKAGADKIAMDQALDLGRRLLNPGTTREVVREAAEGLNDAERRAVAQGLRSQLDDILSNTKRTVANGSTEPREAIKAIKDLSSRGVREKVATVIGEDDASRLFNELDQAAKAFELQANVVANSRTFARTEINDAIQSRISDGPVNAIRSGEPVNAVKRLTQSLLGRDAASKQRISDETYSALADQLVGSRGAEAQRLMRLLQQQQSAIPGQSQEIGRLTEMLLRRGAPIAVPATGVAR